MRKTLFALIPVAFLAAACAMHGNYAPRYQAASMPAPGPLAEAKEGEVQHDTEAYDRIDDNPFVSPRVQPLSTFSVDVDTASYANVRRFLRDGKLPPKDAVRIEELVNYFPYAYEAPREGAFAVHAETGAAPWAPGHHLVKIGIKGREIPRGQRPASNLVFLLDVSGSMAAPNKLPLLQKAMKMLVEGLDERDRVAIVVYAGASGLVLPSTSCRESSAIVTALDRLYAGGSTNGGAGIELAYQVATEHRVAGGVNRVILATDGDFNVGVSSQGSLTRLIEQKAKSGVSLTVLGFGMGNYKDSTLEKLAAHGNGNYAYIDTELEAKKVLVEQLGGTLVTIARDVKLQVEFNPAQVEAWRLIGYENRLLRAEDFNDDRKDAGDIGEGHTVTALYEIVPAGVRVELPAVDPLRYQREAAAAAGAASGELMTVKIRHKEPEASESRLMSFPVALSTAPASGDFRFASAVAAFGMVLRESPHRGAASLEQVLSLAEGALGEDRGGYRREFLELAREARRLGD